MFRYRLPAAAAAPGRALSITPATGPAARIASLLVACATTLGAAWTPDAAAQSGRAGDLRQIQHYDIDAGPLSVVLTRFSAESGIFFVGATAEAGARSSPGVRGSHTAQEALRVLLEGTGLHAQRQPDGSYSLRPQPDASAGVAQLAPVRVVGAIDPTSEGTGSYASSGASMFKGAQSLKDIPQSVTVITRQQIDDQRLDSLDDVLARTPGVTLVKRPSGGSDIYTRGFMTNTIQYDGVPLWRATYWGNSFSASSVHLDRVEVLRGAQGLLEGTGNPAGAVNLVRKRGLAENAFAVEMRAGSWDNYGTRIDTGGALGAESRVRTRLVMDYEDKGSFIDTVSDRNLNLYGAVDVDLTPDTTLGLGVVYTRFKGGSSLYGGVPFYANGRALDIRRSTYLGADWNTAERRETQVFADLEHRFNADWKFKIGTVYTRESWDATSIYASGSPVPIGGDMVGGNGYVYDYNARNIGLDANVVGKIDTMGMTHDVVFGANYSRQKRDDSYDLYSRHAAFNVFDPDHHVPELNTTTPTSSAFANRTAVQKGVYGMLRSHLTERFTLITGARMSWYRNDSDTIYGVSRLEANGRVTPYAGMVYALTPQWSAYASYADIFQPQTATDAQLSTLKPVLGSNYEIGLKGGLLDGKLETSIALFRIDQKNRAVTDFDSPRVCDGDYCSRAAGKVRSEGLDMEIHGEVAPGVQITGGYTYNRNKYLSDEKGQAGQRFDYKTPKHILHLWANWRLPGELARWQLGAGASYYSALHTSNSAAARNTLQGGYTIWDGRIAYQIDQNWQAALNVKNLFDKRYYSYIDEQHLHANHFGTPRSFLLTLRGQF
ncbi:TonB-dependent siderophore receptor [Achromobacter xylosoxidans]|uniref:TonB-dependent siderophore receptor n=1 Tax=Alcaligenes xylosoxydans xylosoxydans TaxID=85698 RepID=UPI0006C40581|nr:TonB-dependent receptor [Achromobacter xylosoxidans]CUJ22392.1 Fe(III)-pyochelin receptor [Achromobacter xylosoxidans]